MPPLLAGCVAAVPPLVLLASTHLTVVLVRSHRARAVGAVLDLPTEEQTPTEQAPAAVLPEVFVTTPVPPAPRMPSLAGEDRRLVAARLRDQGESNKAIARELGVAPSTVGRWFKGELDASASAPAEQDEPKEHDT